MNTTQINYIQDSFLLYGTCSNPNCAMGLSPFSIQDYTRCPVCDDPAILPYSLSPILQKTSTNNIYKKYFPSFVGDLFEDILDKGEDIGNTPLSQSSKISEWSGIKKILFKEEGNNPSGSFKDRGSFMAIALLQAYTKRVGLDKNFIFGTVSTGNMAISTAFMANQTSHKSFIAVSSKIPQKKIDAIQKAAGKNGTTIFSVNGEYANMHEIVYKTSSYLRKNDVSIFSQLTDDVFRISGYATLFTEIIEQLLYKSSFPDVIILPIGSGALFRSAVWTVEALLSKGHIKKIPRIVLVQEIGGDPIIQAMERSLSKIERITVSPITTADAIAVSNSRSGNPILRILQQGYHLGIGVETVAIQEAKNILESQDYFVEEASCASLAAARKLRKLGKISRNETVICVLTGANINKRKLGNISNSKIIHCSLEELEKKMIKVYSAGENEEINSGYFC